MIRHRILACAALLLVWNCSSSSTHLVDSWKAPGVSELEFGKVLALAVSSDEAFRRVAEDKLVERLNVKTVTVPSYAILGGADLKDTDAVRGRLQKAGFDGVVTVRVIGQSENVSWQPASFPTTYYSFWPYYGYGMARAYDPGYLRTETVVRIETNIYSLEEDEKLLWSGVSETIDPANTARVIDDLVNVLGAKLRTDGLIK